MLKDYSKKHSASERAREILRYIGPGLLITVGFIDPGNWASNLAAGADFGYLLLFFCSKNLWNFEKRKFQVKITF